MKWICGVFFYRSMGKTVANMFRAGLLSLHDLRYMYAVQV